MTTLYGMYYVRGMLDAAKWPRKQGLLGREVINVTALNAVTGMAVDWGAALGAGRPNLAFKVLSSIFGELDQKEILSKLEAFSDIYKKELYPKLGDIGEKAPHEIIEPGRFKGELNDTISASILKNQQFMYEMENNFLWGLEFGLYNKKYYEAWYKKSIKGNEKLKPTYEKLGMQHESIMTLEEEYSNAEEMVNCYQQEMGTELPKEVPEFLLNYFRKLKVT